MARGYLVRQAGGFRFLFAWDNEYPDQLHIFVRHATSVEDALNVFFNADPALDYWNAAHQRWESENETHGLYWQQLDDETILIISCFHR